MSATLDLDAIEARNGSHSPAEVRRLVEEIRQLRQNGINANASYARIVDALGVPWRPADEDHEAEWVDSDEVERAAEALRAGRSVHAVRLERGDLLVLTLPPDATVQQLEAARAHAAELLMAYYDFEVPVLATVAPTLVDRADATSTGPKIGAFGGSGMTGERSNEPTVFDLDWALSAPLHALVFRAAQVIPMLLDALGAVQVERDALRERFADLQAEHQKIAATQGRIRNRLTAERDEARARAAALQTAIETAQEVEDRLFIALLAAGQSAWPDMMPALVDEARKLSIELHGVLRPAAAVGAVPETRDETEKP